LGVKRPPDTGKVRFYPRENPLGRNVSLPGTFVQEQYGKGLRMQKRKQGVEAKGGGKKGKSSSLTSGGFKLREGEVDYLFERGKAHEKWTTGTEPT